MVRAWSRNLKKFVIPLYGGLQATDPTCDAILKRFAEMDECPADWPMDWKQHGRPLVRRESTVFRVSSVQSRWTICVKIVHKGSRQSDDSSGLFAALCHYHARSDRENGYTVPEPYGWVPEYRAVIMEWVEGRTYGQILKKELISTNRRHENLRRVAGWLRWFHSQSKVKSGTFPSHAQVSGIIKVFDEAPGLNKAATAHDPAIREFLEVATKSAGVLQGIEMDRADLHGDFKPTNLIISSTGVVTGIDFTIGKRGPVSHDIFRFLSDLDLYRNLLGRSSASNPGSGSNDFDTFLSAYGGRAGSIARPVHVYLYFLTILRALVHQRRNFKKGAVQVIRLAVLRRIAGQLSNELSKGTGRAVTRPARVAWRPLRRIPVEWLVAAWQSDVIDIFLC